MSPQYPAPIAVLAAPGLLWLATTVAIGQVEPAPRGPSASQAPTSAASSPAYRVLLLSNGRVVRGEITEDPASGVYRIKGKGGPLPPLAKAAVKKAAGSLEELYAFQVQGLPPGDPDERMKLVKWCLTENLQAQAREQLDAVLAMCPGDADAKRMSYNLQASVDRAGPVDAEVRQTGAEMGGVVAPGNLDPSIVKRVRRGFGANANPEVFNLPPAVAVKRANEFVEWVQPVLQKSCAGCHNEKYAGDFQLVEVKSRRDRTNPDISRANLEATLRLVNPDDPARSELLSAGLVPHGPNKGAIFQGPADPGYRTVVAWVRLLKAAPAPGSATAGVAPQPASSPAPAGGAVTRTGYEPPSAETISPDRAARSARGASATGAGLPTLPGLDMVAAAKAAAPAQAGALRTQERYDTTADFSGGLPDSAFEVPYAAGGPAPKRPAAARPPAAKGKAQPKGDDSALPDLPEPAATANPAKPVDAEGRAVLVGNTDNPNTLPGMDQPMYPTAAKAEGEAKKAKPKLDPAALEKMMRNRNGAP